MDVRSTDSEYGPHVAIGPLIGGEGIDLVVQPPGRRSRTVQLTVKEARKVALDMLQAADESEQYDGQAQ